MEVKTLQDIFIKILRSELNETELDSAVKEQLTPNVISALFSFSKRQDLAHIVSSSLYKNGLLNNEESLSKYSREEVVSIYRYEQMRYTYEQICDIFNEANIPYIPLKGSVTRRYYPQESMRTSCDIDILVKEENLDNAIEVLIQKGFKCGERNYHDVPLYSPNKVHLELHFNILEKIERLDVVLKDAWLYVTPTQGCCYEFTKEFFIFHIYAHMFYHFLSGGCGVRPLMDVWIIKHKMGISYVQAKVLLEKAGIYKFASEIDTLVENCFSGKSSDEFTDVLLSYIINGGVFGTSKNRVTVTKTDTDADNIFIYAAKRLFLPYHKMAVQYPLLKKFPIILPICWISRFFKIIFSKKARQAMSELKVASDISQNEIDVMKMMQIRMEL